MVGIGFEKRGHLKSREYREGRLTAGVVGGGQEDTTGSLPLADDVTGSRCGENAVLADNKLLDAISNANLCNQLNDLGVPEASITSNNEGGA